MKWSWRIGSYANIGVYIHATFLLVIAWTAFTSWRETGTLTGVVEGLFFTLLLFVCVVLHEFGHALMARRYGIPTRDITIYPIGGVARLERMPEQPLQELWVALAGPAVNVALAAILWGWLSVSHTWAPLASLGVSIGPLAERLLAVNVSLTVFNLIPAFPMDGGRVLRALLALRLEYTRATQIAAAVGQGLALLFGLVGLAINPTLLFIAFFVWIGASQEASMVQMKTALGGIPVARAMLRDFRALTPGDPLSRAVDLILAGSQADFPVTDGRAVVGIVTRNDLLTALAQQGQSATIESVMRRDVQLAEVGEMLEVALARLQVSGCHILPVMHHGQLVGLLTTENVGEFLMIQSALRQRQLNHEIRITSFA